MVDVLDTLEEIKDLQTARILKPLDIWIIDCDFAARVRLNVYSCVYLQFCLTHPCDIICGREKSKREFGQLFLISSVQLLLFLIRMNQKKSK